MTGKLPNVPTLFDEQPTVAEGADNRADGKISLLKSFSNLNYFYFSFLFKHFKLLV